MRRTQQSPTTNVMENLSGGVGDLEAVLFDLADDTGDERACLRDESRSAASRWEGGMSPTVHAHERSLAGRGVGCLAVSRAVLLE